MAPQPATGAVQATGPVQAPLPLPPAQAEPKQVRRLMRGPQHDVLVSRRSVGAERFASMSLHR